MVHILRNLSTKLLYLLLGYLHAGMWGQVLRCRFWPLGIYSSFISPTLSLLNIVSTKHPRTISDSRTDPSTGSWQAKVKLHTKMHAQISLYFTDIYFSGYGSLIPCKFLSSRLVWPCVRNFFLLGAQTPMSVFLFVAFSVQAIRHIIHGRASFHLKRESKNPVGLW